MNKQELKNVIHMINGALFIKRLRTRIYRISIIEQRGTWFFFRIFIKNNLKKHTKVVSRLMPRFEMYTYVINYKEEWKDLSSDQINRLVMAVPNPYTVNYIGLVRVKRYPSDINMRDVKTYYDGSRELNEEEYKHFIIKTSKLGKELYD